MRKLLGWMVVFCMALTAVPLISQTAKVGTFDKKSIVLAYYRSPLWAAKVQAKQEESKAAQAAGDAAKVKELQQWGQHSQEAAHEQMFKDGAIPNILEDLKPAFEEIKKTDGLSEVVVAKESEKAVSVDVTEKLLVWLKVDEATRKIIREFAGK